jgi:serine/threonine protein kinase
LREGTGQPVLVDFGLAGRKIRPGCATLCYGAPEIWESQPNQAADLPAAAADVYAFGCFAYEVMTATTLFDGNSDVAIISAHITHDGLPPAVSRMAQSPALQPFASLLYHCLRHNPLDRPPMTVLRGEFDRVRAALSGRPWPLRLD